MAPESGWLKTEHEGDSLVLCAGGSWMTSGLSTLDGMLRDFSPGEARSVRIDVGGIERLDTAGAWVLYRTRKQLRSLGVAAEFAAVKPAHGAILERIERGDVEQKLDRDEPHAVLAMIERTGFALCAALREAGDLVSFLGVTTIAAARAATHPRRIRFVSLISHIERVGLNALPIVGLLSFLIGVVVAYQGADQLTKFGANLFVVDLLGISILREMGILLTAIIVAGRSGSAFAAEIGTMQINEEVDAMRTIGLDPIEVLVLPRLFALTIALPLLAVFADVMGIIGGAMMAFLTLDISPQQFIHQFENGVGLNTFMVGLIKAPVFGILIALVGCREGLSVSGSAESIGRQTTKAVVVAIFLVILVDAIFSVFFSYIGV